MNKIKQLWENRPLLSVMLAAIAVRIIAVVASKGFGMYDDHFCVVEVAQRWLDGHNDWLGQSDSLRSLVYPGLHYLLFGALQQIGIFDPQAKMFVVRVLHAAYSLFTVYFGFKIVQLLSDTKTARLAGLLLAAFWLIPFMSVRTLIEFVCTPPMVAGAYFLYKDQSQKNSRNLFIAGLLFGLAFVFRFQTAVVTATIGLILLLQRKWKGTGFFSMGVLTVIILMQGTTDWIGYGRPFSSFIAYVFGDNGSAGAYPTGPWYQYIGLIAGILIPPTGLLLLFGFFGTWKKYSLLFWPTMVFLVLHSIYPNKQERFILPVLPFILMVCVMGWRNYAAKSKFWQTRKGLLQGFWVWFWIVNVVLLAVFSTTYSKKTRCETLSYLYHKQDVIGVVLETSDNSVPKPPLFYLGKKVPVILFPAASTDSMLSAELSALQVRPNYIVMMRQDNMKFRLERLKTVFPEMVLEKQIEPSFLDQILFKLNPEHNVNSSGSIYRVK